MKSEEDNAEDSLATLIENVDTIPGIKDCSESKMYLRQWLTAMNLILVMTLFGLAYGHSTVLIQQLKSENVYANESRRIENGEFFGGSSITVDSLELQSWTASSMILFMSPGCWILAACSKKFGRKPILISVSSLLALTWMMTAFARNIYHIIISKSISGLCLGQLSGLVYVYIGECSIPKLRSILNNITAVSYSGGVMICHALGTWFHWRTTAFMCGVMTIVVVTMNIRMPESPIWLLNKHKLHKAIDSWTFLRGIRDLDEFESMYAKKPKNYDEREKKGEEKGGNSLCTPNFLKPLGIVAVLFISSQMCGMGAVIFYCIQLMNDVAGPENGYIAVLFYDAFRLTFSAILAAASKKFSTRTIVVVAAFNCSFLLIILSLSIKFEIWSPWLSVALLFCYEAMVTMGLNQLPWTFCSELFPVSNKDFGVSVSTSFNYVLFFIVVKTNPYVLAALQPWGTFMVYGLLTLVNSIILYFILPNTRNKSLKEIEMMFATKAKS